jgi:sulfur-oxidizing protein SoxY
MMTHCLNEEATMINRRSALKAVLTSSAILSLGVLIPRISLAAWNKQAFSAADQGTVMDALYGSIPSASADINLKAPDIAENGAVVPITISTNLPDVKSISVIVANNPLPLAAQFMIPEGTQAEVSCRIRMGETSPLIAVVETKMGSFKASKEIKVTIGGCGG